MELGHLQQATEKSLRSNSTKPHIIIVSGSGGVGKTQLVRKFIENNRNLYVNVVWIDSERQESIVKSFERLAQDVLDIPMSADGRKKDFISIVENVFNRLSTRNTLFVCDNVVNVEDIKFIITTGIKLDIVITSRIQDWGNGYDVIQLNETDETTSNEPHNLLQASLSNYYEAISCRNEGKHDQAFKLFESVFEKRTQILGEDHRDTLECQYYLALSCRDIGKRPLAMQMFKRVLKNRTNTLGEDHRDTLVCKCEMGFLYRELGQYSKAFEMFQDVFEKRKNNLGGDHRDTIQCKYFMAFSCRDLGRHSRALQMFQDVYEKRKRILGEDHLDTLESQYFIGLTYRDLEENLKARQMFQDVLERRTRILGADHPLTLECKFYIDRS